jgi:hypothetical protein
VISTDRPEFEKQFAVLCASQDVPCTEARIEAFWRSLQSMTVLQFVRTIDHMLTKESWARMPKPAQVWEAFKRMRAAAPPEPKDDGWRGDDWDIVSNNYLRAHIALRIARDPLHYGRPASVHAMQSNSRSSAPNADASPEFIANVQRLVAAKKLWAADMRDMATEEGVPVETQKAVWHDYLNRAEAHIAGGKVA